MLITIPLGAALGIVRLLQKPVISAIAVGFIDFFRTAPLLVLIFWFYYAFPVLAGLDLDPFAAAALAVGLQFSAFFAELFRGGIASIARGQREAAMALGMPYTTAMRYIILPQAVRRSIPVFFALSIDLLKATSVAASIAYAELTYNASRIAADTFRPIETFMIVAVLYLIVIVPVSQAVRRLETVFAAAHR